MRVAVLVLLAGCLQNELTICGDIACPVGSVCDSAHHGCATTEQLARCAGADNGTACTTPAIATGECHEGVCFPAGCGNSRVDADEACDDGNNLAGDGCSADCHSTEQCGNGIVDPGVGEACDDGNNIDADGCQANCHNPTCGDGVVDSQFNEQCDDGAGNSNVADASCRMNCQLARCGDGVTDAAHGEVCDDGNLLPGDGCRPDCASNEVCGNGKLDFAKGEQCDDGNFGSHDGCDSQCQSETYQWIRDTAQAPIPVEGGAGAYDEARRTFVMTTGYTYYSYIDATEELVEGRVWRRGPSGVYGRYQGAMAYDAARKKVILFGGADLYRPYADTWAYDGKAWTPLANTNPPTQRSAAAMAYDSARKRIVMFGGRNGNQFLGDTVEWDGSTWTTIPLSTAPSPRHSAAMTYDPLRGEIVLFGGVDSAGSLSDTWTWNGSQWTAHSVGGPSARSKAAMSFDPHAGGVLLTGGTLVAGDATSLWKWDGASWSSIATDGAFARVGHVQYFDRALDATVIARGQWTTGSPNDELFVWNGSSVSPLTLAPHGPDISAAAVAYDERRGQVVVLEGVNTWVFDGVVWTKLAPAHTPPARTAASELVYDRGRAVSVLFGGNENDASVWEWDGTDWTERAVAGPPTRSGHQIAFDVVRGVTVVYGGYNSSLGVLDDMWTWDGTAWTELAGQSDPGTRSDGAMTYDQSRHVLVMWGGYANGEFDAQVWEWDGTWTLRQTAIAPNARTSEGLTYDPLRHTVIMQGGQTFAGASFVYMYDTWEWNGTSWRPLTAPPITGMNQRLPYMRRVDAILASDAGQSLVLRSASNTVDEACETGFDLDGDSVSACADPDCWGYCTPSCAPGQTCSTALPRCGDGTCSTTLENCRLCPGDCGACSAVCGDLHCDPGETDTSCPGDCL